MKTEGKGKHMKCSCIWLCVLCLASWHASAAEKLPEWESQQAAEQNCVSASKYGLSEKCGVCGGVGWLKKSRYAYVAPTRGKLVPGRRGRKQDYYAQCKWCLEKKSRWEKQKEELQRKEFERKRKEREAEISKAWKELELQRKIEIEAEEARLAEEAKEKALLEDIERRKAWRSSWRWQDDGAMFYWKKTMHEAISEELAVPVQGVVTAEKTLRRWRLDGFGEEVDVECCSYRWHVVSVVDGKSVLVQSSRNGEMCSKLAVVKFLEPHGLVDGSEAGDLLWKKWFKYVGPTSYVAANGAKCTVRAFEEMALPRRK